MSALKIGDVELDSRLILGTGKYADFELMRDSFEASGTGMVTVAIRRVNLNDPFRRVAARLHRPRPVRTPAQHGRMLYGQGRRTDLRTGSGSAGYRYGKTRSHRG